MPSVRRAFSLLELLVVVGIIALLLGILVPTLGGARSAAQTSSCLSNMRGMALASLSYSADNDDRLIDVGYAHGGAAYADAEAGSFINTLSKYTQSPLLRRCAADKSVHWSTDEGGEGQPVPQSDPPAYRRTSYGVSNMLTETARFPEQAYWQDVFSLRWPPGPTDHPRLSRLKKPSSVIQFVEMTEIGPFAGADHTHLEDLYVPGFTGPDYAAIATSMMQINRHGGKVRPPDTAGATPPDPKGPEARSNFTFLDGSARTLPFGEAFVSPTRNMFDARVSP